MPATVTNQDSSDNSVALTIAEQNLNAIPFAKNIKARTSTFVAELNDDQYFPDFVSVSEAFLPKVHKVLRASPGHPYFARSSEVGLHFMNGGLAALSAYPITLRKFVSFKYCSSQFSAPETRC